MIELIKNFLLFRKIIKKNILIKNWLYSLRKNSFLNENQEYLPWLNYNLVNFITERVKNKLFCVFEYGCGYSTLFWSTFAENVHSVENNKNWFEKIQKLIIEKKIQNINLSHKENDDFINNIEIQNKKFEIILIDSFARVKCIKKSINFLSENGIIILDNSDRIIYKRGVNFLIRNNFKKINFVGLSPNTFHLEKATIFYKENNIFDL